MDDRPVIPAEENSTVVLPGPLGSEDREVLAQAGPELMRVSGGERPTLELGPVCGVLELDGFRLTIGPKLLVDGRTTVAWIAYAASVPVRIDRRRGWSIHDDGLRDVVVDALVHECSRLVADGLLRDYRCDEAEETTLRGRLDVGRQIARRYGQVDRLHVHRFARQVDVTENLVCRAALDVAFAHTVGERRRRLRDVRAAFPGVAGVDARAALSRLRYHRLNVRYRAAHRWASLLLGGGGVDDFVLPGRWPAGSLLINMNRLWEHGVARACRDASTMLGGPASPSSRSISVTETGRRTRPFRPDALLYGPATTRPVDAKYKRYADRALEPGDVHQLLTYGAAYDAAALLVHPAAGASVPRRVDVRSDDRLLGSITVVPVDVTRPPDETAVVLTKV